MSGHSKWATIKHQKGAKDKGGDVDTFTVDNDTYAKNKKSDRDKDGIACEAV